MIRTTEDTIYDPATGLRYCHWPEGLRIESMGAGYNELKGMEAESIWNALVSHAPAPPPEQTNTEETENLRAGLARLASSIDIAELQKMKDKIGFHPDEIIGATRHARFLLKDKPADINLIFESQNAMLCKCGHYLSQHDKDYPDNAGCLAYTEPGHSCRCSTFVETAAPQQQADGRVVAALIAALKDRPTFGGTPQTAFGREYREWEQSVDAMLLELDGPK